VKASFVGTATGCQPIALCCLDGTAELPYCLGCRYYSLFTLGMLVMFECTVVFQRQKNLHELRSLQTPKQRIHVYRGGKWEVRAPHNTLP
jgi:magnesium-transporting ATPase (P-type)